VLLGISENTNHEPASPVEHELGELLRGLVDVTDVHDEFSFDDALSRHIDAARESVWMWSPWVAKKSSRFLPLLAAAVARNVDVRVFVRTEDDPMMATDRHKEWVERLREAGATVIRAEVEHRKVVVVDRGLVLIGSHNPLSQRLSREVMIACRGAAFAERMLDELHAEILGHPPECGECGRVLEIRRSASRRRGMPFVWRCRTCRTQHDVGTTSRRR
jgi:phosphatidylserine/phosphatidylglycerophosphate/cardiolipin synthase-like enzyme